LPAPRWTLYRMFAYGRLTPSRAGRMAMWQKMCEEGGVRPGDGAARNPEDPAQALLVGPVFIGNGTGQMAARHETSV